jgi:hypothetical protein
MYTVARPFQDPFKTQEQLMIMLGAMGVLEDGEDVL